MWWGGATMGCMLLTRSLSVQRLYVGRHKASLKYIQSLCCSGGWERCSIKMSLQQGYLHPLACILLTLSSPMPGQHNGRLLYSQCGPFLPFPARSGLNPQGVLLLCFSELRSNCLKWGGLVKHLLCKSRVFGCAWFMLKAVVLSCEDTQQHIRVQVQQALWMSPQTTTRAGKVKGKRHNPADVHLHICSILHNNVSQ